MAICLIASFFAGACSTASVSTPRTAPTERERGTVEGADGASIYYERTGSGPAVVLIHGLGGNHAVWYRQVPRLAQSRTVVTLSQRGFAPSTGDPGAIHIDQMVFDLLALLDLLDIEQATLVGQSMGGWTALATALRHPDRVKALVLADTTAGIFDEDIRSHYTDVVARARALADKPPPLGSHPALDPEFSASNIEDGYLYQLLTTFGSPNPGYIAGVLGDTEVDHTALSANEVPTLFIVGERDRIFPPPLIHAASEKLAHSEVVELDGTGHSPYYESPARWADAVEAFLDRTQ